ncbi:DUF3892 domain-containing protein [Candidatus Peregrinibacteria bacterium CG_4_10_14_0_2_um_filter_38_24]|nr:MAG: DUF3892 domain-containing protein [Candidatus Peregrinibacteria bacterium CG_4_10_14_0_2_um_filter_38_24]
MTQVRITCINKDRGNHYNPHEAVSHYGWLNPQTNESGKADRASMVVWLETQGNSAYVMDRIGNKAYCGVRKSANGNKFLQTYADQTYTDNLLNLPEC